MRMRVILQVLYIRTRSETANFALPAVLLYSSRVSPVAVAVSAYAAAGIGCISVFLMAQETDMGVVDIFCSFHAYVTGCRVHLSRNTGLHLLTYSLRKRFEESSIAGFSIIDLCSRAASMLMNGC